MDPIYVIKPKHLPPRLNLTFYGVVWLLLDRFQPPEWVWGVAGCLCAFLFITSLIAIFSVKNLIIEWDFIPDTYNLRLKPKQKPGE